MTHEVTTARTTRCDEWGHVSIGTGLWNGYFWTYFEDSKGINDMILYRCTLGQRMERPCIVYVTGFGCTNQLWIGDYMQLFFSQRSQRKTVRNSLRLKGGWTKGAPRQTECARFKKLEGEPWAFGPWDVTDRPFLSLSSLSMSPWLANSESFWAGMQDDCGWWSIKQRARKPIEGSWIAAGFLALLEGSVHKAVCKVHGWKLSRSPGRLLWVAVPAQINKLTELHFHEFHLREFHPREQRWLSYAFRKL